MLLLNYSINITKKNLKKTVSNEESCLEVIVEKNKYLFMSRQQNVG
jgi:hypothetical protein